jgi:hypothetical protein
MKFSIFALAASFTVALAQECPTLQIVYARATTEPPQAVANAKGAEFEAKANRVWSRGFGAAGYSLVSNVTALLPGSSGYAVQYPVSSSILVINLDRSNCGARPLGVRTRQQKAFKICCNI